MGTQIEDLLSVLSSFGVVVSSGDDEHQAFCDTFNYVFNPIIVPLASSLQKGAARSSGLEPDTEPAVKAFQSVFRKHFRRHTYINWSAVCEEAKKVFERALMTTISSRSQQLSAQALKSLKATSRDQMEIQGKWIKGVNDWKRDSFQKSANEDGLKKFRQKLLFELYPMDGIKFYEEADILQKSNKLMTEAVSEFSEEIPAFEGDAQREQWYGELRQELSQMVTELSTKNGENRDWKKKASLAVWGYTFKMSGFLEENPFASKAQLDSFQTKAKAEEEADLDHFLQGDDRNPALKAAWDSKVDEEFANLTAKWRGEGDDKIAAFQKKLKSDCRKRFEKHFDVYLKRADVDHLLVFHPNALEVARSILERENDGDEGDGRDVAVRRVGYYTSRKRSSNSDYNRGGSKISKKGPFGPGPHKSIPGNNPRKCLLRPDTSSSSCSSSSSSSSSSESLSD